MICQVLGEVGEARAVVVVEQGDRACQGHLAEAVVMAIGLAVGGDRQQAARRRAARLGALAEAVGEVAAVVEQAIEGDVARQWTVVEDEGDLAAGRQAAEVGLAGVERRRVLRSSGRRSSVGRPALETAVRRTAVRRTAVGRSAIRRTAAANLAPLRPLFERPPARRLVWLEDGEAQPLGGQDLQRFDVDRRLRQPHPGRLAAEAMAEVGDPPAHLGPLVARRGERQDRVVVGLCHRRAVTAEAPAAALVGAQHGGVDQRALRCQPGEQRRPEVEADGGVVVHPARHRAVAIEHLRSRVRRVALLGDALVPVVERLRRGLALHPAGPRVVARRLVEVAVDTDATLAQSSGPSTVFSSRRKDRGARWTAARPVECSTGSPRSPSASPPASPASSC